MVLSDRDIAYEIAYGGLEVDPVDLEEQLQPASLDIRLGHDVKQSFSSGEEAVIDSKDFDESNHFEEIDVEGGFVVYPGKFYIANTIESFSFPEYLEGEVTGRSSIGRLGITIHQTAGLFDPGFSGEGVLEIKNVGETPVKLYPGQRVGQMVFSMLSSPAKNVYNSEDNRYQNQRGAVGSRIDK